MTLPVLDLVCPFIREGIHWTPLYLFLIVLTTFNFKRTGLWWVVLFLITVSLTDLIGNQVMKQTFQRLRPCSDPDFFMQVRLLVINCSGGFSFTSNHAANHFGLATFFFVTYRRLIPWAWVAFIWAGAISYAQVYVGVHYPFDILGGALLGISIGTFTGRLFNKRFGFAIFDKQPTLSS